MQIPLVGLLGTLGTFIVLPVSRRQTWLSLRLFTRDGAHHKAPTFINRLSGIATAPRTLVSTPAATVGSTLSRQAAPQ